MRLRGGPAQTAGGVWYCGDVGEVHRLLDVLAATEHPTGLDCEYTYVEKRHNLEHSRLTCLTLAYRDDSLGTHPHGAPLHRRVFVPAFDDDSLVQLLKPWLEDAGRPKVGHNIISADAHVLRNHGIVLRGIVADTLRESRMAYNSKEIKHGLKPTMLRELGYEMSDLSAIDSRPARCKPKLYKKTAYRKAPKSSPLAGVPTLYWAGEVGVFSKTERETIPHAELWRDYPGRRAAFIDYATLDAKGTAELRYLVEARLTRLPAASGTNLDLYRSTWQPYCELVAEMEVTGIPLDLAECARGAGEATADIERLEAELAPLVPGVNWGSSDQLKEVLFRTWNLPRPPITGTVKAIKPSKPDEWSTAEASLHWLELNCEEHRPALGRIRRLRKARRLFGYLRDLPGFVHSEGRLHTVLAPSTDTGRLASSSPPLQQIPNAKSDRYGIRRAFVAGPGRCLIVADYCVVPWTKILTSDLHWTSAGSITAGQELIGFDEHADSYRGRRFKRSVVTGVKRLIRPCRRFTMSDGAFLTCSTDHMWLARKSQHNFTWRSAASLGVGDHIQYFGKPWRQDTSREGGYLAGVLDGEGWVSKTGKVGFAQLPNACLGRAEAACTVLGLDWARRSRKADDVQSVEFYGAKGGLRVLGMVRPSRLMEKAHTLWEGKSVHSSKTPQHYIVAVEDIGECEVVAIETDSKTYVAEGYLSHNCQLEVYVLAHFLLKLGHKFGWPGADAIATALKSGDVYNAIAQICWPSLAGANSAKVKVPAGGGMTYRDLAKIVVLARNYGKTPQGLAVSLLDEEGQAVGLEFATAVLTAYDAGFPALACWTKYIADFAAQYGGVATVLGRWRPIPEARSDREYERSAGARKAANTPIQGSAADVVACAGLGLRNDPVLRALGFVQALHVHDEAILIGPEEAGDEALARVVDVMEHPPGIALLVPLKVEAKIAPCWAEGK